jgi:hypothetical protein
MANILRKAAIGCGLAGVLAASAAVPSLAQVVVVDPYYGGAYGYVAPGPGYVAPYPSPYEGYAYAPGYRGRVWDYPVGTDSTGQTYSRRDLGWQPGPPSSAPANPCWPSQRTQNLC